MRAHRTRAGQPSPRQRRRIVPSPGLRSHALVSLVSRLVVAEAGACAAIGVGYNRRHLPWLLLTVAVAVALCGLAALVRSGTHTAWLAAITVESGLVAIGLFRFAYAGYLGGTLLAIITLGTLLRPAVSRAFSAGRDTAELTVGQHSLAESAAELQGSAASP
jgi:O-antigen ligase